MNPERWTRFRAAVEQALEAGSAEPRALIEASCAGDAELAALANSLVDQAHAVAIEPPYPGAAATVVSTFAATELLGRRFGPYRAIGIIGEGAMGTVYLAVRADDSFERQVAVKVLKGVLGAAESRRRFDQERRLLARLEHPFICRLLDGGSTEDGLAFIVMEYVDGRSLNQWADLHPANTQGRRSGANADRRARVALFARICDAVAYAHQAGIVHRDLKPANILITQDKPEEVPQPKIIDFGIARVLDSDLTTCISSESRLLGTLPYMAPEQVAGNASGASTRADVYSLGIIFYELLAGRPPLDVGSAGITEAMRRIKDEEPTRLGELDRTLRGDLDTIVAKAMEKDPRRRYASAVELAADLHRWLSDQPIVARRPSRLYQTSKFVRRHRVLVVAAAAVFLALSTAVILVSSALIRVERESQRTREVNAVMRSILSSADPFSVPDGVGGPRASDTRDSRGIQAVGMLDGAARWLTANPIDDPLVEADIRQSLGLSYSGLGRHDEAVLQLERALALWQKDQGSESPQALECTSNLATVLGRMDEFARAEELHRVATSGMEKSLGPLNFCTLRAQFELAFCLLYEHKYEEAAALCAHVEESARSLGARSQPLRALSKALRAVSIILSSDGEQGAALAQSALEDVEHTCGPDHYVAALLTCTLGGVADAHNDLPEAEHRYRSACASYTRLLGDQDPRTAARLNSLGNVLCRQGRYVEAEHPLRRAVAVERVGTPLAHQVAGQARKNLAQCLRALGRDPEADDMARSDHRP